MRDDFCHSRFQPDNSEVLNSFEALVEPLGIKRIAHSTFEANGVECAIGFVTTVQGAMEAVMYCVELDGKQKGIAEQKENTRKALNALMGI